ncbi:MAG: CopD family protein [Agriterribacter sp.]
MADISGNMMYPYIKALHIIFVITWFAGLFYMPRLLVYNTEANDKPPVAKEALQEQFTIMMKRLWYGITWPSGNSYFNTGTNSNG